LTKNKSENHKTVILQSWIGSDFLYEFVYISYRVFSRPSRKRRIYIILMHIPVVYVAFWQHFQLNVSYWKLEII